MALGKLLLLIFLLLSYSSCTDEGCIEADDFGEYEQEIVYVPANGLSDSCEYDSSKELNDTSQGSGLKACFVSDTISSFTGIDGVTYESNAAGCYGLVKTTDSSVSADTDVKALCAESCRQKCINSNSSSSTGAEPDWVSTSVKISGQNSGVSLTPSDKIFIKALGNVVLSGSTSSQFFTKSTNDGLQSLKSNFSSSFIDVDSGITKSVKFSGKWSYDSTNYFGGNISTSSTDAQKQAVYNGARRLVAYLVPHPSGYSFDSTTATSEKDGTKGTPLNVDPDLWNCTYDASDKTKDSCSSYYYGSSTGYSGIATPLKADDLENVDGYSYQITNASKADNLGSIGGMIRWNGDSSVLTSAVQLSQAIALTNAARADSTLASAKVWFESVLPASFGGSSPTNGSSIASWTNLITSASNNATQTTSADQPTYSSIGINGLPALSFDGLSKFLSYSGSSIVGQDYTVFVVEQREIDGRNFFIGGGSMIQNQNLHLGYRSGSQLTFAQYSNDYNMAVDAYSASTPRVHTAIFSSTDGKSYYINGTQKTGLTCHQLDYGGTCTSTQGLTAYANAYIGKFYNGIGYFYEGKIGEIIMFNKVLTDTERQKVEKYLEQKWINSGDTSHDITMKKSGFVSFSTLLPTGSTSPTSSCTLKGRIINPYGSTSDFTVGTTTYEADYYEYGLSVDPLDNGLTVPFSIGSTKTWSDKIFVRKGQVIRLYPESWDSTWTSGTITRNCGVGMAMKIEPRPAFLCRGNATESVSNSSCKLVTDGDGNQVCRANGCYDNTIDDGGKFCPTFSCQVASPADSCVSGTTITKITCSACYAASSSLASTTSLSLNQCYDLESYTGKVSNIPTSFTSTNDFLTSSSKSKGAVTLSVFDGSYGNFSSFSDSGKTEGSSYNSNAIYNLSQTISFNQSGRLKFLLIYNGSFLTDGTEFTGYKNNGTSESYYKGTNGYKIDLSGKEEYSNGKWLEAILCLESSDSSTDCSSSSTPVQVSGVVRMQPNVVKIDNPTVDGQDPLISSYYQFNQYGSLTRIETPTGTTPGSVPDSSSGQVASVTVAGDNYYRHSYGHKTSSGGDDPTNYSNISRLRLSFKIKDPEVGNCIISTPVLNQDCTGTNICDGIVNENPFYDGSSSGICTTTIGSESTECQKQYFCASKYYNNSGKYQVLVRVENETTNLSDIVGQVISPVIEIMDGTSDGTTIGQAERIYKEIIIDSRFQAILQILVVTMITFYGVGYMMGVSEFKQSEILSRLIKIGIIYLFISPTGWYWFNQFFVMGFKHGTDYLTFLMASAFDSSTELQQAISDNDYYDKSILFSGIDKVFGMFFSSAVQKKISALLFASIFGWAYLYIIYLSFFLYVYGVANAVLLYLTAQVFISILFVLAPIFFLTLLFSQTKDMFDKWLSELISFSLQQIFLLTTLAFFNMLMYEVIKMSLGYRICWDDVWVINIYITRIKLLSFWTIASMPPRVNSQTEVGNIGHPEGIPSFFSILFIWVIASLMNKFIGFMTDLAASIGGGISSTSLSSGIAEVGKSMKDQAGKMYQERVGKHVDSALQSADRYLFDSGKKADQDRKQRKEQDKVDSKNRNTLAKAGSEAISKFKKENALTLASSSPEEQKRMLGQVRNEAMVKTAKDMGLNDADTDRLINKKSSITNARNLSGLAKEVFQKRNSLGSSLDKKGVDTNFSGKEFKEAMKNLNDDDKKLLSQKFDDGKLGVKITSGDKAMDNLSKSGKKFMKGDVAGGLKSLGSSGYNAVKSGTVDKVSGGAKTFAYATKSAAKSLDNKMLGLRGDKSSETLARKQLESEGAIDRQAWGSQWASSKADKDKISERASEIKQSKENVIYKNNMQSSDFVHKSAGFSKEERQEKSQKFAGKDQEELNKVRNENSLFTSKGWSKKGREARGLAKEQSKMSEDYKSNLTQEKSLLVEKRNSDQQSYQDSSSKARELGLPKNASDEEKAKGGVTHQMVELQNTIKDNGAFSKNWLKDRKSANQTKADAEGKLKKLNQDPKNKEEYNKNIGQYKEFASEANKYKNSSDDTDKKVAKIDRKLGPNESQEEGAQKKSPAQNLIDALKGKKDD